MNRTAFTALAVLVALAATIASCGTAHAASMGIAWGTLPVGPSCVAGVCALELTAAPGDLTVVYCYEPLRGACAGIPKGATVIVEVAGASTLPYCSPAPVTVLVAIEPPRWYVLSAAH